MNAPPAQDCFLPTNGHTAHGCAGRILVADADDALRRQNAGILRGHGYAVVEAGSAARAVEVLRAGLVQAVIADLDFGAGFDLLAEAARRRPAPGVVFHTSSFNVDRAVEAVLGGASDYFTRPFVPRQLLTGAARALKFHHDGVAEMERQRKQHRFQLCTRIDDEVLHSHLDTLTSMQGHADLLRACLKAPEPAAVAQALQPAPPAPDGSHEPKAPGPRSIEAIIGYSEAEAKIDRLALRFHELSPHHTKDLDLNLLLLTWLEPLLKRLFKEHVHIQANLGAGLGLIHADAREVQQLLLTLAFNAWDAMPLGGRLHLRTANDDFAEAIGSVPAGSYVVLSLRDTGHGMDAETRAHMFEPFFTTRTSLSALGLGMSVVADIVARAGGHITMGSEPGRGTDATVYFPRLAAGGTVPDAAITVLGRKCGEVKPC